MRNITEKKTKEQMKLEEKRNKELVEFWELVQQLKKIQIKINKIKWQLKINK